LSGARFVFLVSEGPESTVIDSQVVDAIVAIGAEGVAFDLLFLPNPKPMWDARAFYFRRRREIAERIGRSVRLLPIPRRFSKIGGMLGSAAIATELWRARGPIVAHARSDASAYFASSVARRSRRFRFVYDVRGDIASEFRSYAVSLGMPEADIQRQLAIRLDRRQRTIDAAAHVLCVSTVLRDRLVAGHRLDPARTTVVPCVADAGKFGLDDAERARVRVELGLDGRFVVIYPGRFGAWHYNEETFAVVRGLMDADASVFFLILTPDLDAAQALAARMLPEGRYAIRSARHDEVPRYLRAADLGVLLRAPDPLNEVACPTKFAEYVMTGLPVLISAGIGDCSPLVAAERAGAVLAAPDPSAAVAALAAIRAEPEAARRARIAAVGQRLSRQRFAREMAAFYRRIAEAS
jgi:glycosyltransferase involved in cell wall biosynthesis